MHGLSHDQLTQLLLALALLLGLARLLGELALRLHQPAVLGELLAGIVLGPTVLGRIWPAAVETLFASTGEVRVALDGITQLALALFLLVAGMEVDLSTIWRQGKSALVIGAVSLAFPFALGYFGAGYVLPLMGPIAAGTTFDPSKFAWFFATALSISALPVIVKTLMDLSLYRTDFGMVVVAVAILNDLIGWIIFAVLLSTLQDTDSVHAVPVWRTVLCTLGFAAFTLTIGRIGIDRAIPFIQAHASWPGGVLGFAMTLGLLGAAFTNWIGIHPIFGTFLVGVALGDSRHLRERTRATIDQFISCIFAPLFFASVGLKVDFLGNLYPGLTLAVIGIATFGKVLSGWLAARCVGFPRGESWAIGWALNSRGAMEIILGMLALKRGLINEPFFVALVIMALVTSMSSGNFIRYFLHARKPLRFTDFMASKGFVPAMKAFDCKGAIRELVTAACEGKPLSVDEITEDVWSREQLAGTSVGNGVALPHSGVSGLLQPIVAVGLSSEGVDFDSPDGMPSLVVFLILTPQDDRTAHLDIVASICTLLHDPKMVNILHSTKSYTQFLACVKTVQKAPH